MDKKILEYLSILRDFGRIYSQKISGTSGMKLDLKLSHIKAMYAFREVDRLSANELADLVGTKLSTATIMTDSLEKEGIVSRERDSTDRRKVMIRLTPKGKKMRRDFLLHRQRVARSIFARISEQERSELKNSLATVCRVLQSAFGDVPGLRRKRRSPSRTGGPAIEKLKGSVKKTA